MSRFYARWSNRRVLKLMRRYRARRRYASQWHSSDQAPRLLSLRSSSTSPAPSLAFLPFSRAHHLQLPNSYSSSTLPVSMPLSLLAKHSLARTSTRTSPLKCNLAKHARHYSSLPRPYCFHVGASWAGKPHDPRAPRVKSDPFPPDSPVGKWRDATLSRPNAAAGRHIGEDFFYIQDVSVFSVFAAKRACIEREPGGARRYCAQMRDKSVSTIQGSLLPSTVIKF